MKTRRIITRTFAASAIFVAMALWTACTSKPKSNDIIARKPAKAAPQPTQTMGDYSQNRTVNWLGSAYTLCVERKADKDLQLAKDESGNKYYDNRIKLVIRRSDDSEFFNRTFSKADFTEYVGNDYKDGALLGIVFDHADADNLYFAASRIRSSTASWRATTSMKCRFCWFARQDERQLCAACYDGNTIRSCED